MSSDTSLLHLLSKFCCCKDNGNDRERLVNNRGAVIEDAYHIPNGFFFSKNFLFKNFLKGMEVEQ